MGVEQQSNTDLLWNEYAEVFRGFDDLTLARWMCQTLGQLEGRAWRLSHPLIGAYRLGAKICQDRQIWFKRLATLPAAYSEAPCCRAPFLPLLTRDAKEMGLFCMHCTELLVPFSELPASVGNALGEWAEKYNRTHNVAHFDDRQRKECGDYDRLYEMAASDVEQLLGELGGGLAPMLLEFYPAVAWEDSDECLEVRPEDIRIQTR